MDKNLLNELKNKSAFLFDYDGTIVDNEGVHLIAYKKVLKKMGKRFTKKDFKDCCVTFHYLDIMTNLENRFNFKIDDRQKFWDDFLKVDSVVMASAKQKVFPYVHKLLELFPDKKKIVVSNERDDVLDMFLKNVGLFDKFDRVYSCFNTKPKTVILSDIKKHFGVDPKDAILFEDSAKNIISAQKSGITTVAITHAFNKGITADFVLKKGKW